MSARDSHPELGCGPQGQHCFTHFCQNHPGSSVGLQTWGLLIIASLEGQEAVPIDGLWILPLLEKTPKKEKPTASNTVSRSALACLSVEGLGSGQEIRCQKQKMIHGAGQSHILPPIHEKLIKLQESLPVPLT